jgi:hypothetical protein
MVGDDREDLEGSGVLLLGGAGGSWRGGILGVGRRGHWCWVLAKEAMHDAARRQGQGTARVFGHLA